MSAQSHWAVFANLQNATEPRSMDQSLGREEALNEVLNEITTIPSAISDERILKRFVNLCGNRSTKYRHRRKLDEKRSRPAYKRGGCFFVPAIRSGALDISEKIALSELVTLVQRALPEQDFQLLRNIAEGDSYCEISSEHGVSTACIKARVFRIRERIKRSPLGQMLCAAWQKPKNFNFHSGTERR